MRLGGGISRGDRKELSLDGCPLHAEHRAKPLAHDLILCPEQMLIG